MVNALIQKYWSQLKGYSQTLNNINAISNKTWVTSGLSGEKRTYRFQQDGRLLVGINGDGEIWHYEFFHPNSLTITANDRIIILNHGYLFDAVLGLQKEGTNDTVMFYDENIIPDGDIETYIKNILINQLRVKSLKATDQIYYVPQNGLQIGSQIYDQNLEIIKDRFLILDQILFVLNENHKIQSFYYPKTVQTNKGTLIVLTKDGGITEELMVYTSLNPPKKAHGNFEVIESKSIARLKIFHGRLMSIQEHKLKMPNLLTLFVGFIESYWVLLIILGFIPIILAFYRWISST